MVRAAPGRDLVDACSAGALVDLGLSAGGGCCGGVGVGVWRVGGMRGLPAGWWRGW
jgi:hypothetical protein